MAYTGCIAERRVGLPSRRSRKARNAKKPAERVNAPVMQQRAKVRKPALAIGWLRLLPKSVLPIKSHEDFSAKLTRLLFPQPRAVKSRKGARGLPHAARAQNAR
jgi:hypothetical protein